MHYKDRSISNFGWITPVFAATQTSFGVVCYMVQSRYTKFACHINVKICILRGGAIKYLFKYISKRNDRLTILLTANNGNTYDHVNNIKILYIWVPLNQYTKCCNMVFIEAKPTIEHVVVYLPGQPTVYFKEDQKLEDANRPQQPTKLTQWFVQDEVLKPMDLKYDAFPAFSGR